MNADKKAYLQKDPTILTREEMVTGLIHSIKGEEPEREGLKDTPLRVAAMYDELFWGYGIDPEQILRDAMFTDDGKKSLVLVKDITFASMCEHHMMPFFGTVAIAYIPQNGQIVGLSKLARLVDACSKKLQVQERLGQEIMTVIKNVMNPLGVAVIIKAEHTCMTVRGVQKPGSTTTTSTMDGVFYTDEKAREELVELLKF